MEKQAGGQQQKKKKINDGRLRRRDERRGRRGEESRAPELVLSPLGRSALALSDTSCDAD